MHAIPIIGGPHDGSTATLPSSSALPKTISRRSIQRKCLYRLLTVQSAAEEDWQGSYERVIYLYEGLNAPPVPEGWCIDDTEEEEESG